MAKKDRIPKDLTPRSRYRVSGQLVTGLQTYRSRSWPVSCASRTYTAWNAWNLSTIAVGQKKTISDWVDPGYWLKRKAGLWIESKPLYIEVINGSFTPGTSFQQVQLTPVACTAPNALYFNDYEGALTPYRAGASGYGQRNWVRPLSDQRDLYTEVVTRCLAQRDTGKANYVETLAELDQAWHMMGHPIENLCKFIDSFAQSESYKRYLWLRKRYPKAKLRKKYRRSPVTTQRQKQLEELQLLWTSEYLRYRYGISPILSDIEAAKKELEKMYSKGKATPWTVRAKQSYSAQAQTSFAVSDSQFTHNWTRTDTETYTVKAQFSDMYEGSAIRSLGFTLPNVIGLPWELTRLSFVVDWVLNIGDFIYANIPRVNIRPLGGCAVVVIQTKSVWRYSSIVDLQPTVWHWVGVPSDVTTYDVSSINRFEINPASAGLVIKDDFRLRHWKRAADAVAIAIQQIQRIRF